jgi:uncharacterized protein YqhQ
MNGVMMKGKQNYTVSVNTSKGMNTKTFPFTSWTKKYKLIGLPFIRGVIILIEVMGIGYKSLSHSADVVMEDETGVRSKKLIGTSDDKSSNTSGSITLLMIGAIILSMLFAIFLFKFLPLLVATLIDKAIPLQSFLFNIVDGLVKIAIFVAYLYFIGKMKDIKELFRYHGGEHKVINCYEGKKSLTIKNILSSSQVHLRCGTTFIFVVLFFSILVYLFIPKTIPFGFNLLLRLALLPIIAAISYEVQQFNAKKPTKLLRPLIVPGLWLQALTVNNPAPKHAKAAKAALLTLLKKENVQ